MKKARPALAILGLATGLFAGAPAGESPSVPTPPSRIIVAHHAEATEAFLPKLEVVQHMVDQGVMSLTGARNASEAWKQIVLPSDSVGIKVVARPGSTSGTRLAVVEAVIQGLIASGHEPGKIIVWDRQLEWLMRAGYGPLRSRHGVRLAGAMDAGWDERHFYESSIIGNLVWGDLDFKRKGEGVGKKSYVSKLITQEMTKIIHVPPLLNHNQTGVSGAVPGLALASVDNLLRFEANPEQFAIAIPEIYALPELADKVCLNIVDALLAQFYGETESLLHYSHSLNELWISKDPVALDVYALKELEKIRERSKLPGSTRKFNELFENAALLELGTSQLDRAKVEKLEVKP